MNSWLYVVGFILIVLFAYIAVQIRSVMTPTKGTRIGNYSYPRRALLVVDIQEAYTGESRPSSFKNVPQFIDIVNRVIEAAAAQGMLIVYISHEWPDTLLYRLLSGKRAVKGQPDTAQDHRLIQVSPYLIKKSRCDAFSNPELEKLLTEQQVEGVVIVGLDAVGCAYKTALGALYRGYKTTIVLDAVTTMFKKTAQQLAVMYQKVGIAIVESNEITK